MVKKAMSYENSDKPTCIDSTLTNCPWSFQNSCVVERALSDFQKIVFEDLLEKKKKKKKKNLK